MVLLVMLDGVRPDAITPERCPHVTTLAARGARSWQARSVLPSVTLPCHMSIFHSVPPTRHGIMSNQYVPLARPLPGVVEVARAANLRSAFVHNWEPLRDLARPEQLAYAYFREPPHDATYDDAVADEAARLLRDEYYDFVFVYFGSVDAAGHLYGWMSDGYLQQLAHVDGLLGRVLDALPADASVVVQSDHGGHERTHGTDSPADMTIPWVVAGPGIRRGHTISGTVSLLDTAPTIARLLGIAAPREWEGHPVEEIFL
jgi:predicted AlkP superfamily pyrophosphatase or phosphodiesterase